VLVWHTIEVFISTEAPRDRVELAALKQKTSSLSTPPGSFTPAIMHCPDELT
jgi:hypothetical protein